MIKLYGTKGITDVIPFYKYGIERGSTKKISFAGKDVGEIQQIRVNKFLMT